MSVDDNKKEGWRSHGSVEGGALEMSVKICGNQKQPGSTIKHRQESGAVHWAPASCLAAGGD